MRQRECLGGNVVSTSQATSERTFRLVDENRIACQDLDNIVPGPRIDPYGFLNSGSNRDLIIPTQGIDEDDLEIPFGWNKAG